MAKIIEKQRNGIVVEHEESDPIYSEGWTIGSAQFTETGKPQTNWLSSEEKGDPKKTENSQP